MGEGEKVERRGKSAQRRKKKGGFVEPVHVHFEVAVKR
jgi:hypothetical protein